MKQIVALEDGANAHSRNIRRNQSSIPPAALKLKDAADYLGVSAMSLRRLINRGLIKTAPRALRHIVVPIRELDRFINGGAR